MNRLATDLESGRTLEESLAAESKSLPPHLQQLISAGAKSGKLADVLVRFVDVDRSWVDLGRNIRLALAYPALLFILLALIFVFAQTFLVPRFINLYYWPHPKSYATEFMFWLSGTRGLEVLGIAAATIVVLIFLARIAVPARIRRRWVVRIPMLGSVIRLRAVALWSRLMELLLKEEIPLAEALQIAGAGANDAGLAAESKRLSKEVANGKSLADSLSASRLIPASLRPIVRWGEQTGALPEAFRTAGDMLENRAQLRAAVLQSSLAPIAFVVVGLVTLFMIRTVYLQVFYFITTLTSAMW
jgi:type II secretory pathway component PulF